MIDYYFEETTREIIEFARKLKLEIKEARMIKARDIKELKKKVKQLKEKTLFLSSTNYKLNRYAVENKLVNGLINIELHPKPDFTHFRRAGLDDVLAKFMKENNVMYVINFNLLLNPPQNFEKFLILGRMLQNYRIAKINETEVKVVSGAEKILELKSKEVLKAFERILKK